jgi:hypothetical protein
MTASKNTVNPSQASENLTEDAVYDFYTSIFSAIWSSLPLLLARISKDIQSFFLSAWNSTTHLLMPWTRDDWHAPSALVSLYEQALETASDAANTTALAEFLKNHKDDMKELVESLRHSAAPQSWLSWLVKHDDLFRSLVVVSPSNRILSGSPRLGH